MSASIAFATSTRRPALSQLVAANSPPSRSIWRYARHQQPSGDKMERISQRIDKYHRHPLASTRSKAETRDWPSTTHRQSTGGWAVSHSRSGFSDLSAGREQTSYNATFGNRSFKPDGSWTGSLPSFLKIQDSAHCQGATFPSKAHLQDFNFTRSSHYNHLEGFRYDPISGRMVPEPPRPETQQQTPEEIHEHVIDCPPGSEVEAKFASNPIAVEDGQFQPGPSTAARYSALSSIPNSKSVDCSPGSELEALFAANPASFQEAKVQARIPEESAHKPNIHIACPRATNSSRFLSLSLSHRKGPESKKPRNADVGLGSLGNVECPPGSELEAMFISKPTTRAKSSRPIDTFDAHTTVQQTGIPVDCPPGSELEAKFATELPNESTRNIPHDGETHSVECSPGNEIEAKIVSDIANQKSQQPKSSETVECAPGSELEAMFITDPAAAAETHLKPTVAAEPANTKKANVTVDCQPGSELEAKMISDAMTDGNTENLGALQASEIRARYTPKPRPTQKLDFDGSEDRVGDFLSQQQHAATKTDSVAYRILAYDSAVSQVTTTEAESFFGDNDTAQPHEILARLHNPAKFVPYFAQLQQEGFEIATGGGDILVFKNAVSTPKQDVAQAALEQNPQVHAQISQYLRHDSYPTNTPGPSFKPHPGSGPSNDRGEVSPAEANSLFRKMMVAGIATAASCYAIGVVIEYFRTGGQDGRGIDGFTAFESDRRQD
ncbi:hypothetical protein N7492_009590 [Penicillium capsulatum]|uniref:Uncharacterized protein n=1 Tax=Penicillium capsulatum TaxID=69766 RepID=A0A9W9HUL0_9EURO|nr:hypothetical protein N7492_009590 [Penicillium capsulatum]KAJ6106978.1 hypothetical protein N7512_010495 [Penicillium capsulatum]